MKIQKSSNNQTIRKEIGNRVKTTRISMNLTREDFSKKTGISVSTISRLEEGKNINVDALFNVLRYFQCIDNIDLLLTDPAESPMWLINSKNSRQRATRKKKENIKPFIWEEDKI